MTKKEITDNIARRSGITAEAVKTVIDLYAEEVSKSLIAGENVYHRGFGTFRLVRRAAKVGRDISRGVTFTIPEHTAPGFKPSPELVNAVKEANL